MACKINEEMPEFTVKLLRRELKKIGKTKGASVAVLGLSYKANIEDVRESPSFEIIKELEKEGIKVKAFDPYVAGDSGVGSLDNALDEVDAVILATNHKEFSDISPEKLLEKNIKILIDGRNYLNKEDFTKAGVSYVGIGR